MIYGTEMASCGVVHGPSLMKISTGVQAILSASLSNLSGCNIGNTLRRSDGLRWRDIRSKIRENW
jgi:hypothetical protein